MYIYIYMYIYISPGNSLQDGFAGAGFCGLHVGSMLAPCWLHVGYVAMWPCGRVASRWPPVGSSWPHVALKLASCGLKLASCWLKLARVGLMLAQVGLMLASNWVKSQFWKQVGAAVI